MEDEEVYFGNNDTIDFNQTYNEYTDALSAYTTVIGVLFALICAIGLIGNALVIYVVLRFKALRTVTNTYILNLAIADSLFLIGIPLLIASITMKTWPFGYFMCKTYMIGTGINQFTSSIFVCIMSADRYLVICHPKTSHRFRTTLIAGIVSSLAWTTSILMMLPIIMYTTLIPSGYDNEVSCNVVWPDKNGHGIRIFIIYNFAASFAGPLALIVIFYYLIIIKLKNNGLKLPFLKEARSRRRVSRMILTVISVYVLCWLPYWVMQLTIVYTSFVWDSQPTATILFFIASCLAYSNSAINPILYAFLSDNFRKRFNECCSCFLKNTSVENANITSTVNNNETRKTEVMKLDTTTYEIKSSADFKHLC